jgi:hypothetical protein
MLRCSVRRVLDMARDRGYPRRYARSGQYRAAERMFIAEEIRAMRAHRTIRPSPLAGVALPRSQQALAADARWDKVRADKARSEPHGGA